MRLTDEEQALRAGCFGPAAQSAIAHQAILNGVMVEVDPGGDASVIRVL